jgi:hypothetical protein
MGQTPRALLAMTLLALLCGSLKSQQPAETAAKKTTGGAEP